MLQLSEKTLGDWLEHWAEVTPDKEYIVYSDRNLRFTWKQFNERVDHMAKGLLAIGVKKDTHVGIWARNVPVNPEKPDVPLNKNDAFQKVQKRHVQEKR